MDDGDGIVELTHGRMGLAGGEGHFLSRERDAWTKGSCRSEMRLRRGPDFSPSTRTEQMRFAELAAAVAVFFDLVVADHRDGLAGLKDEGQREGLRLGRGIGEGERMAPGTIASTPEVSPVGMGSPPLRAKPPSWIVVGSRRATRFTT